MSRRFTTLAAALMLGLAVTACPRAHSASAAVKSLLLGHHSEHHNSATFEPMPASSLAERVTFDQGSNA